MPRLGAIARAARCNLRSQLTTTPSFSAKEHTGKTTCARLAVSVRNSSLTTTRSQAASACSASARSGALRSHSSPTIHSARMRPSAAARRISGAESPGSAGSVAAHCCSKGLRPAASPTGT